MSRRFVIAARVTDEPRVGAAQAVQERAPPSVALADLGHPTVELLHRTGPHRDLAQVHHEAHCLVVGPRLYELLKLPPRRHAPPPKRHKLRLSGSRDRGAPAPAVGADKPPRPRGTGGSQASGSTSPSCTASSHARYAARRSPRSSSARSGVSDAVSCPASHHSSSGSSASLHRSTTMCSPVVV